MQLTQTLLAGFVWPLFHFGIQQRDVLAGAPQFLFHGAHAGRFRAFVHAQARRSLVDQVDGLVRQKAVWHVARREVSGLLDGFVGDLHIVVFLIGDADPLQDFDRFLDARLFHLNLLEATFQRGIVLNVFAIFVQRGRADALQFAAGQRRLEDVGRVHAAAGRAGAHQHVHLVDEEDAVRGFQFLNDALQPFLELAAIHRARHQRADVQLQHALVQQRPRRVAADDALRQALDDGRLAHARLADQRRVVLAPPAEHLNHTLNLHLAPHDRVQLAFLGGGGQVRRQLVDQLRLAFARALAPFFLRRLTGLQGTFLQHAARLAPHFLRADSQALQHLDGHALGLAHQTQQQMLGADVVMPQPARLIDGQLEHALGARRQVDLAATTARTGARQAFDQFLDAPLLKAQVAQHAPGHAAFLAHQAQQQMFGADGVVPEALRLFLRQAEHSPRPLGEAFHFVWHVGLPPPVPVARTRQSLQRCRPEGVPGQHRPEPVYHHCWPG